MTGWYLRRALPWRVLAGGLLIAGALLLAAHRWESLAAFCITVAVLAVAGVAGFVHDEPALALARVTPRGTRWVGARRLAVGAAVAGVGAAGLRWAPTEIEVGDWALVLAGVAAVAVAASAVLSRREQTQPGGLVATVIVLAGLTPLVLGAVTEVSVYPAPDLTDTQLVAWSAVLVLALATVLASARHVTHPHYAE